MMVATQRLLGPYLESSTYMLNLIRSQLQLLQDHLPVAQWRLLLLHGVKVQNTW